MRTATASSTEVGQQGTLAASYWCGRLDGESYPDFRRRLAAEDLERRAAAHETEARKLRQRARELTEATRER